VQQLETLIKGFRRPTEAREHERSLAKAKQWFKLDNNEYQHQKSSRETFVQQSLQNYLIQRLQTQSSTNTFQWFPAGNLLCS
jgi:ataxia telangiectasia mutated family protein